MTTYNVDKMYTYLKGYITGAGFTESMKALGYAREKHKGQFRKDGVTPYIVHPLQMACYAVALGIKDDCIIQLFYYMMFVKIAEFIIENYQYVIK